MINVRSARSGLIGMCGGSGGINTAAPHPTLACNDDFFRVRGLKSDLIVCPSQWLVSIDLVGSLQEDKWMLRVFNAVLCDPRSRIGHHNAAAVFGCCP